jgi:predicted GNAT family N-acyltransferase
MKTSIIHTVSREQIDTLHTLYRREWWTSDRSREEIKVMLQHSSIIIGVENDTKKLLGFARILTDHIFKAEIYDLIVDHAYRDQGIGKQLMEAILNHSDLLRVKQFNLQCKAEMIPYYEKWGFTDRLGDLCYMRYAP